MIVKPLLVWVAFIQGSSLAGHAILYRWGISWPKGCTSFKALKDCYCQNTYHAKSPVKLTLANTISKDIVRSLKLTEARCDRSKYCVGLDSIAFLWYPLRPSNNHSSSCVLMLMLPPCWGCSSGNVFVCREILAGPSSTVVNREILGYSVIFWRAAFAAQVCIGSLL